jgi:CheY-like chemotaxis protein
MPVMNGFEAIKEIRSQNHNIPVIAVTAYGMAEDKKKCLDAGFNTYLSKPFNPSELGTIEQFIH